ncbi:MAG TPA: hypothetical protein DEF43_03520 [Chloroflexus aurantiacus]|uniref:Periplasmic ligand-binding sensor domain-like protein n=1 Tax=Chloroflexus aurantiacus (strain ATCC 29366 / DSM 635 / J-10-fl) TaxID=324602 RepID=A9WGZ1_CHLAA|nr:CHASE3 domain-containing protein [Chloroflexus aurantiacus]ABY34086.1 periplasmic ligand-binding sensor domain-like protein [Chloroflexus aurantiacus J-10-fl]HBW66229.1 hypothetical protein [Chloroflexus aurantiacus]
MSFLNQISLRNKILLLVALLFVGIIIVSVVAYQSLLGANEREQEVRIAYSIIAHTRQLEASMHMMESGERGFLITGDPVFLEKYESGKQLYLAVYSEMQREIPRDSEFYTLLEEVDRELEKWKTQVPSL